MTADARNGADVVRWWLWLLSTAIAIAAVGAFTVSVIYVVIMRQLTGTTPDWSEELPRLLLVWSVFVGIVPATLNGSHFGAGLLPATGAKARWRRRAVRLLTALFFGLMALAGWQLTIGGMGSFSTTMNIPYAVTYAAVPFGCALAAIAALLPANAGTA